MKKKKKLLRKVLQSRLLICCRRMTFNKNSLSFERKKSNSLFLLFACWQSRHSLCQKNYCIRTFFRQLIRRFFNLIWGFNDGKIFRKPCALFSSIYVSPKFQWFFDHCRDSHSGCQFNAFAVIRNFLGFGCLLLSENSSSRAVHKFPIIWASNPP